MSAALASLVGPDRARVPLLTAPPSPSSAPPLPDGPCPVCPRLAQEFEPWRQASYWKAMHERACQREDQLQRRVAELEAQLRLREQQLFGRKTEAHAAAAQAATPTTTNAPARRRGQQPGRPGPRRRDYSHLPAVVEEHEIPGDACCCRRC